MQFKTITRKLLADTFTPVTLFLSLRDYYPNTVLLESNDFKSMEDCHSFIGLDVMATFEVNKGQIQMYGPVMPTEIKAVTSTNDVATELLQFLQLFEVETFEGIDFNGVFGHTNFDSIQYFDSHTIDIEKQKVKMPDMRYSFYRFVLSINHFNDSIQIIENCPIGEESKIEELIQRMKAQRYRVDDFKLVGEESSNLTDEEFKSLVTKGKEHCRLGDVFQIVFSRQFAQSFKGDDFNVYRLLRSINPSPYLFYFDYGDYRVLGSSPETQLTIRDHLATVNPIAGTYRRSGDSMEDARRALALAEDPKENAEHIMLVDLARNDLSRHAQQVEVKKLREVQFFSHVIHLVSTVGGELEKGTNPIQVFGDTFPAGTLSGAPKYKALQLISQYENQSRAIYGGGLGVIDLRGHINHAIVIRSFLSTGNTLYFQAGAGVVVDSQEEKELKEVNNKLAALKKALIEAEKI